jgi:hypothetical protein
VRGSPLLAADESIVHVDAINRREGSFAVYNIEVTKAHNYLVSRLGILVHNQCAAGGNGGVPPRKPSPAIRREWEAANDRPWPKDPNGNN